MPTRCVVAGCSNSPDSSKGIFLHKIPFFGDNRPEAKSRRKQWIDFIKKKRSNFIPSSTSVVCSDHFSLEDYYQRFDFVKTRPQLIKDEIGTVAIPKKYISNNDPLEEGKISDRSRRKIVRDAIRPNCKGPKGQDKEVDLSLQEVDLQVNSPEFLCTDDQPTETEDVFQNQINTISQICLDQALPETMKDCSSQTKDCIGCVHLQELNRQLKNKVRLYQERNEKLKEKKATKNTGVQCAMAYDNLEDEDIGMEDDLDSCGESSDDDVFDNEDEECAIPVDERAYDDCDYQPDNEQEPADGDDYDKKQGAGPTNLRKEKKYIVFLSKLLMLFQFCHWCKTDNPLVEYQDCGTMTTIKTICQNPNCQNKEFSWNSQPLMPGSRIPAGNFLLSFGILLAGGCASKVMRMFTHMGLACFSLTTYFKHQRTLLFPAIHLHWKAYQAAIMKKLKKTKDPLTISGDGRFDSMGHSAKYGTYTIFCCTVPMIIYFSLVQRNEAGNSNALELEGFTRCMTYLLGSGLAIKTFVSDRHSSIAKYMREKLGHITHYFDLWHLKKSVKKALTKIANLDGCQDLKDWIRPCLNHLHWSATSTISGQGRIILAKFKSFLGHIVNKHNNLDDQLFHKCAHGADIKPRKWLHTDSEAYEKLTATLTKQSLVKAIQQASPTDQTSCLEGFHSLLNHFSPKMLAYSHSGMFCRHILATLHFNSNLKREVKKKTNGQKQVNYVYPKFKNGEATIKDVRVKPNFDYVEDIYNAYLEAATEPGSLKKAQQELDEMAPPPMNSVLINKESKEKAMEKKLTRESMAVKDVPPTTPLDEVLAQEKSKRKKKNPPCCRECKKPMKGHALIADCILNIAKLRQN